MNQNLKKNPRQCHNQPDICELLEENPKDYVKLLKQPCEPTIILMNNISNRLLFIENNFCPLDVILDDAVLPLLDGSNLDPNLATNKTAQGLSSKPFSPHFLKGN